ncbi:MAG: helix-turn-helix domain-containing protein, partial [Proteobacteria bacterium]|nr:helix-turn-helix domain-containing protein [Pseudomonadota bacterium]
MDVNLGGLLKQILQEKGLSVTGAAQLAGISASNLSRILNGQVNPAFTTVLEIVRALGIPPEQMMVRLLPETPQAAASVPAMQVVLGLENTELSARAAGDLLLQAAQGGPAGWAGRYMAADVPAVRLVDSQQVGTRRLEVVVAFPHTLLEAGSIASLLSVASSALAGTGARLLDVAVPEILLRTFSGPMLGLRTVQDRFNKHGRPLLACTIRPMQGLSARMYGRAVYEALMGGMDFTADPTLLHSVAGNNWRER